MFTVKALTQVLASLAPPFRRLLKCGSVYAGEGDQLQSGGHVDAGSPDSSLWQAGRHAGSNTAWLRHFLWLLSTLQLLFL